METITETKKTVLDIQAKHEVKDYPYGRLRTSAFFSIEFRKGKGFRSVFQTINPKTGKLNAEKKGTYYTFLCNKLDESNGHINTHGWSMYGLEEVNKQCKFLSENFTALNLTPEMISDLCLSYIASIKANCAYSSVPFEKLKPLINESVTALVEGAKEKTNVFGAVNIDIQAYEALKKA